MEQFPIARFYIHYYLPRLRLSSWLHLRGTI
jgi:hypothetical protein